MGHRGASAGSMRPGTESTLLSIRFREKLELLNCVGETCGPDPDRATPSSRHSGATRGMAARISPIPQSHLRDCPSWRGKKNKRLGLASDAEGVLTTSMIRKTIRASPEEVRRRVLGSKESRSRSLGAHKDPVTVHYFKRDIRSENQPASRNT